MNGRMVKNTVLNIRVAIWTHCR